MQTLAIALAASGVLFGGFAFNEAAHGDMAEWVGLGHQHMFDYGGYHCMDADSATMWERHVEHMHGGNFTMPHGGCAGGHQRYHDAMHDGAGRGMGGGLSGGMMQ